MTIPSGGKDELSGGGGPRNPGRNCGAGGFWRAHQSVLLGVAVAGADADAEDGAGEGFQLAVGFGGQVAGAVTGVDAGDEHHEYGGDRAGKNAAMTSRMMAEVISLRRFGRLEWRGGSRVSPFPGAGESVTVTVGRGKGETNNTVLLTVR